MSPIPLMRFTIRVNSVSDRVLSFVKACTSFDKGDERQSFRAMPSHRRLDEATRILQELQHICAKAAPGDRLPTHRDLMRRHRASERMVLRALEELQRSGHIERRNGIGTFVTAVGHGVGSSVALPPCDDATILVITRPDGSFFDRCLEVLHRLAVASGRRLMIHPLDDDRADLALPALGARPSGVLLLNQRFAALARRLLAEGCRVAVVGAPEIDALPQVPSVHGDHEHGGFLATYHLFVRGHKRVAILGNDADVTRSLRWRGHQRAVTEARRTRGAGIADSIITQLDLTAWEADPQRAVEWWRSDHGATGIAAWNDHEAARLLAVFTRAHISVPDDVALVGYDDLPEGRVVHPPITTVDQQIEQQLRAALDLITRPDPPPASHVTVVMPTLIPRRSSDARVR